MPEGIEGRVPYKGSLVNIVYQLMVVCVQAWVIPVVLIFEHCGPNRNLCVSHSGVRESHVHDVQITKEAPNYQITKSINQ